VDDAGVLVEPLVDRGFDDHAVVVGDRVLDAERVEHRVLVLLLEERDDVVARRWFVGHGFSR
jgi:hypothetical protein